jgi:hypothetical protein
MISGWRNSWKGCQITSVNSNSIKSFRSSRFFLALALAAVVSGLTSGCACCKGSKPSNPSHSSTASPKGSDWKSLFDGKTQRGWKVTDFAGGGKIEVEDGKLVIQTGLALSGVTWTNDLPKINYEVEFEAMKVEGNDFFGSLTFPVKDSHCTFVIGGWGGGVVGISSIDSQDASENESTKFMMFEKNRWYRFRVQVTPVKIETWIDGEKFTDLEIADRRISMRPGEIELSAPLGFATYQTTGALRNIRLRQIGGK